MCSNEITKAINYNGKIIWMENLVSIITDTFIRQDYSDQFAQWWLNLNEMDKDRIMAIATSKLLEAFKNVS